MKFIPVFSVPFTNRKPVSLQMNDNWVIVAPLSDIKI